MDFFLRRVLILAICGSIWFGLFVFNENAQNQLLCNEDLSTKSIPEILQKMPIKEKERLEYFFRYFFVVEFLGYVLFGQKPCAISSHYRTLGSLSNIHPHVIMSFFVPSNLRRKKGYEVWLKYKDLFPMDNFVFKEEINPWTKEDTLVLVLNKQFFIKTVKENLSDFEGVLNKKIDPEAFFEEAKEKPLLSDVLKFHEGLIGIICGYGRDNSWQFYKEKSGLTDKFILKSPWKNNSVYRHIKRLIGFIGCINQLLGRFSQDLNLTFLPRFKAIEGTAETEQLTSRYVECRKMMIDFYRGKDFLETTLNLLSANEPLELH